MNTQVLDDVKVPVRFKLSALWTAVMFCYVYGDYFGLYVPGQLRGMLDGQGPIGPTTQGTLVATSILLGIPGVMVFLSLVLPPRLNRWVNIVLGAIYTIVVLITVPGTWLFYMLFSSVEVVLTASIVWYAWKWPKRAGA